MRDQARRLLPIASFAGGFLWDSLTLRRIDRLSDNLLLATYLALLGALIVVAARVARDPEQWPRLAPRAPWLGWGTQFLFGGLYSAYVIFYFKSTQWGSTLLFVFILGALLVLNEFAAHHFRYDRVRIALYCACVFSFLLFFIPVISGWPGPGLFSVAAVLALAVSSVVTWLAHVTPAEPPRAVLTRHLVPAAGVLVALALLDAVGLIPPVPLALMDGGIYHSVTGTPNGYQLVYEQPPWYLPLRNDDRWFRYRPGDKVTCFTAIFAPSGMDLGITHVWEHWDAEAGWARTDAIPFDVSGGRDGGYRGFTSKRHFEPGAWRVRVVEQTGRELGRYAFTVDPGPWQAPPQLTSRRYR